MPSFAPPTFGARLVLGPGLSNTKLHAPDPPTWTSLPTFSDLVAGQPAGPFALGVTTVNGAFITLAWVGPGAQPGWVNLVSGVAPTIEFDGTQTDQDDLSGVIISATANGQTVNSSAGSITVAPSQVAPTWNTVPTIYTSQMPYDLTQHVTGWNSSLHQMREVTANLSSANVSLSSAGILTYSGSGGTSQTGVQIEVVDTAEADWISRTSDPRVVWYHDFRSDSEVNAFRWTGGWGNDPLANGANGPYCRRITTDGIDAGGGVGCVEIIWPTAGQYGNSYWWRSLSPLTGASNGRGVDDPAANGTIPLRTLIATDRGSETANFIYGYYGDPDYQYMYPGQFDGNDYYVQVRVKMDPARIAAGLDPGGNQFGKLFYLTRTDVSLTAQEINTESYQPGYAGRNYFSMYRSGSPPLENDSPGQGNQPGNDNGIVWFDNRDGSADNAFYWPSTAKWVTLLYYVKPMITESYSTVVRVWKAVAGETTYTKIWDQTNIPLPYGSTKPYGHNAIIFCSYQNQLVAANGFYHRMAQIIFKKGTGTGSIADGIPCPNDPVQRGEI